MTLLGASIPYIVFTCAVLAAAVGVWLIVMPWRWRWELSISIGISLMAALITFLGVATALDVAVYVGWLS